MLKFISIAITLCLAVPSLTAAAADCPSAQAIASAAPGALKGTTWAGCDYTKANLSSGLNLENANLNETLMQEANLTNATLVKTAFKESNLTYANLTGANLSSANLSHARLYGVYLRQANLKGANLSSADLTAADLSNADLTGANIDDANFEYAKLGGATWVTGDRVCKPGSLGECN